MARTARNCCCASLQDRVWSAPCAGPSSRRRRRRSSGGPAGRHGPWGSDGARRRRPGASRERRLRGPRTPTVTAVFLIRPTAIRPSPPADPASHPPDAEDTTMQAAILGDGPFGRAVADALGGARRGRARRRATAGRTRTTAATSRASTSSSTRRAATRSLAQRRGRRRTEASAGSSSPRPRGNGRPARRRRAASRPGRGCRRRLQLQPRCARLRAARRDGRAPGWRGLPGYEPYVVEWHRRGKADRPSGTARDLARRILAAEPVARPRRRADRRPRRGRGARGRRQCGPARTRAATSSASTARARRSS